jgi:hypothetical protein
VENGHLRDYLIVPDMHNGVLGVNHWDEPCGVVAGRAARATAHSQSRIPAGPKGRRSISSSACFAGATHRAPSRVRSRRVKGALALLTHGTWARKSTTTSFESSRGETPPARLPAHTGPANACKTRGRRWPALRQVQGNGLGRPRRHCNRRRRPGRVCGG